ncbi:MAG: DUF3280 domain-containing protein [Deltaproteobacteria bacterium]|nr:DUF3280 domain-containing protein [Deltaproteobacteria bacterium]
MKKTVLFVLILLFRASSAFSANRTIMIFDFKGIGVPKEQLTAASYLLRHDLLQKGTLVALDANDFTDGSTCYEESCALPLARAQGADKAVTGTMIRIGNKIVVESTVFDAGTGKPVLYNSLNAESPSDIDAVMNRLSDSIEKNKPASEVVTLNNITQQETSTPKRVSTYAYMGIDMGMTAPVGSSYLNSGTLNNLDALIFSFELNDHTMLQFKPLLGFSWNNSGDTNVLDWRIMDIGGYYISSIENISPFVGGSVSLHLLNMSRTTNGGSLYSTTENYNRTDIGLFLGGGVMFFRTASVHLYVEAGYQTIFDRFDGNGAQGIACNMGFLFKI